MKINFKKIEEFVSNNRGILMYAISSIATAIIGARYGINTNLNSPIIDIPTAEKGGPLILNSKQAAINSIELEGTGTYSTLVKTNSIQKIYEIASTGDDYTKMLAIKSIRKISDSTYSSMAKKLSSELIAKLATDEFV